MNEDGESNNGVPINMKIYPILFLLLLWTEKKCKIEVRSVVL